MIPSQIIEEIRSKADMVNIISEYVPLRKRGKNYLGLCPFHSEKAPSFTVSPEKQLFHCFGCNEGGNIFAFMMKIENIGFAQAVEEIGAKMGIATPRFSGESVTKTEKDKIYQVVALASQFFRHCLEDKMGEAARLYLQQRGIDDKTSKLFGLGYAPMGWDNLFKQLITRGSAPALIEKSGLILARENQSGYYDRFRQRLIFPVYDQRDRLLAFGGRALGEEEPKYLNSPDTLIYHKGETLFGLNLSKENIRKNRTAILVEGNFDLITPFQAGINNIVATMGTALTVSQCKLLSRYCDNIIMAYDADVAGGVAAERSAELLRNEGLQVKVAQLVGGKDPDEIIRNQGAKAFIKCLETALPYLEFKIRRALSRYNLKEIEARAKALREVAAIIGKEEDPFVQKEYAKMSSALLSIDTETLLAEIKRNRHYQGNSRNDLRRITSKPISKLEEAEKNIITLALQSAEVLGWMKAQLRGEDFNLPEARAVVEILFTTDFAEGTDATHFLLHNLPTEEAKKFIARLLVSEHLSAGGKQKEIFEDCLKVMKNEKLKNKMDVLKIELKAAEKAGETGKVSELLSVLKSEIY